MNSENLMHAALAHSTEMASPPVMLGGGRGEGRSHGKGLVTEVGFAFIFIKLPQGEHLAHVLKQNKSTQNV